MSNIVQLSQVDLFEIIKLSRFCSQYDSIRFPGMRFPWTVDVEGKSYNVATNGIVLVWINSVGDIGPSDKVPDVQHYIKEVSQVLEWMEFSMSLPKCNSCSVEIASIGDIEDETCDLCSTEILGNRFRFKRVSEIQDSYLIDKVAIVSDGSLAIKFHNNAYAYLKGLI